MEGILRLRLLGTVQVERDGEPVRGFKSRKALALLGYLAAQGKPVPREHLTDLFWGDKSEARGRANLSWALSKISARLPGCLGADRHTVQFQGTAPSTTDGTSASEQAPYWLDLDAFEELEAQGDAPSLAAAVELYRGEFLEGLYLHGCAEFELWLVAKRERWRQRVARVLQALVTHHSRRGQYQQSLRFAQRLLALEPWREETYRHVMRLLAHGGQRGAALAQYETCRRALAEELGVEPAEETARLYKQIRDGELQVEAWQPERQEDLPVALPSFLVGEEAVEVERPVFVARERELAQLGEFLDQALAGQGQVVFVIGDAGQGKTALIQEFTRRAQAAHPDLVVASGNGNAHTGIGDPYLPFREVLGLLTGDVEARWAAGAITRDRARRLWHTLPLAAQALVEAGPDLIDTFLPGAALVKRAVASAPVGADWLPQLEELVRRKGALPPDPSLQQSALFEQYSRVVEALARQRPLLLVLDDLQWADAGSISLLFHLGRRIEGSQILIAGIFRPEEVALGRGDERHPLEPVVNEFKRHFGDIVVDLAEAEGRQFVDAFLDTEPNRLGGVFRRTLYQQTGGHPLFTIELLRGMEERGDLVQDQEGQWVEGPALDWETLPARVEAVIAERIGRLPQRLQDALAVASVEGETFTAELVARVRAADEREMVGRLSGELDRRHRLVSAQGVLRRDSQRLSVYRFRHILFQRYLYNSLDPVERVHLHETVAAALETLYGEGAGEIAVQLARHFQEAGIGEKAQHYLYQAGEQARRQYANEEAITHFRRALALLEDTPTDAPRQKAATKLYESLGDVLQLTGQHDGARTAYQNALASIPSHDQIGQGRLHRKTAATWASQHRYEKTLQVCDKAETALGQEPAEAASEWWQEWVDIQFERRDAHYMQGKLREMTELVEKVRPVVEQHGTPLQRAGFFATLVYSNNRRDRFIVSEQTLAYSQAYLEAAQKLGALSKVAHARFVLGFNLLWHGELTEAEEQMQTALELAARVGDMGVQRLCLTYLTIVYRKLGQVEEAMDYALRSLEVATWEQNPTYIGTARANLAWVAWRRANLTEALENGKAALESWQQSATDYAFQWLSLYPLTSVALAHDRVPEAVEYARGLLEPAQQALPDALQAVLEEAIKTWERGEPEAARTHLDRAIELAQEMGYL